MIQVLKIPIFNIFHTLSLILKGITPCMHSCTEAESENLGIFFLELFQLLKHWMQPEVFETEIKNYSGFSKILGGDIIV